MNILERRELCDEVRLVADLLRKQLAEPGSRVHLQYAVVRLERMAERQSRKMALEGQIR